MSIFIAHQTGLINTFIAKCYLMVSEAIFIVQFNNRLPKKDENYTLVLITSDRAARLSILIAHFIDLMNTFVTRYCLMVSKAIFIKKSNTQVYKSMKITLKHSYLLIGLPDCQY